jgi:pimeloyl-ACP methyl ester carboxylesterase
MNTRTRSTDPHADQRRHEDRPQLDSQDPTQDPRSGPSRNRRDHAVPPSGPVARIIAGSVAAGLAVAVVLVAVVFPGATEAAITGSLLVAFGLGWALLGWATARFTNRALRWPRVPAFAMTSTGLALLVLTPQDAAMRTVGWVWPAPTVALAVYIWVKAGRTVPRRGGWMLTAIAGVLVVAAMGATYENISVVRDHHTYAAPGTTYDVNGHQLYLDCRGQGGPTVVLFNGMGEVSASWARIVDQTDTHTRVCTYDRAGQGWSGDVDRSQDGLTAAHDLLSLLQEAGEHGPFVLAGHSIGGTYALTYAAQYPHQVAGMVLLDSSSPYQFTALPAYAGQYAVMRRGLAVLPTLYRLGLGRLVYAVQPSHLPHPAADVATSLTATARGARNGRDEVAMLHDVFARAQALTTLDRLPMAVLTARESLDGTDGWAGAQDRLAALSTNTVHEVVDSTHMGLLEDPGPAQQSATAINRVVNAVRASTVMGGR